MKILIPPMGGYGDVLSATSIIPGLQKKYPEYEIHFQPHVYPDLVLHDPRISVVKDPDRAEYDLVFPLSAVCENWDDWISKVQCRLAGVDWSPPEYYMKEKEFADAPICDVAVAAWARGADRIYLKMQQVVEELRGYSVIQVDNGPQITGRQPATTMREAAAIVAKAKVVLTIDTAFMHVAAALQKSAVVVFGSVTGPRLQYIGNNGFAVYMHQKPERMARQVLERIVI